MRQNELRTNQFERFQELLPEDSNSTRDAQGRFEDRKIGRLWDFFTSVEELLLRRLAGQENRAEHWKSKAAQQAAVPEGFVVVPVVAVKDALEWLAGGSPAFEYASGSDVATWLKHEASLKECLEAQGSDHA